MRSWLWAHRRSLAALATLAFLAGVWCGRADRTDAKRVSWQLSGASVYGGACEGGWQGYRGDNLTKPWNANTVAQLDSGGRATAPYRAKVRILYHHRKLTFRKRDRGGGGNPVKGRARLWDIWEAGLTRLLGFRNCDWTDVVRWRYIR